MSDRIRVSLHKDSKKWEKEIARGAEFLELGEKEYIFLDNKGKELWREVQSESKDS